MRIAVIGLGYVGLPLAVALARHYSVVGFDASPARLAELEAGRDRSGEVDDAELRASPLALAAAPQDLRGCDLFIVAVPTPVDADNRPDLGPLRAACDTVGRALKPGAVVAFESTVYPGVTEEVCGPALESASGLACGSDFFLGYAPERANPGDRDHRLQSITKVVAGQTPEVARTLAEVYGRLTNGDVFVAKSIKTAEAAKVIENAQRDINIAFVNEVAMIFQRLGLSVHDVLDTAATKWNFLPFRPGLVGGHCIGVDPFYLAHCAEELGHHPEVVLAGRRINDAMGAYVAGRVAELLGPGHGRILVLGLTFKENVPDLRNSKVVDLVRGLQARGHTVEVHDPLADPGEAADLYGIDLHPRLDGGAPYAAVVGAVAHGEYRGFTAETFARLLAPGGLVADVKGIWRRVALPGNLRRWEL